MANESTETGSVVVAGAAGTRRWESIISYEDRAKFHTARWRMLGVATLEGGLNNDNGVLWLKIAVAANTATATLYKDDGLGSSNEVAEGTADVSGVDDTGANAAHVTLSESNSSGLSGEFWIHSYTADDSCPVQVALATDEDLDNLWDGIEDLSCYDSTYGMAEPIRIAGEDVLARVMKLYEDQVGGYTAAESWYITDAQRYYPDLRCIANPGQLRQACAYRALAIGLGRDHQRAQDTAFSELRDTFAAQYEAAMASLSLAFKAGGGANAEASSGMSSRRMERA